MVKISEAVTRGFPTEVHTPNSTRDNADANAYANAQVTWATD
jgi:hypothetical protein